MSLLMKALEKAAKDRSGAPQPAEPAASAATTGLGEKIELTLEPVAAQAAVEPGLQAPPAAATAAAPPPRPASPPKPEAERERAAAVMRAGAPETARPASGRRIHPMFVIGGLAGLAVIAGGIYVYLQITDPALFIPKPPPGPVARPAPPPPAPATPAPDAQKPVMTAAVVTPETAAGEAASAKTEAAAVPAAKPPATPAAAPARADTPRDLIKVSPGSAEMQLDPRLGEAYAALQAGRIDSARQLYGEIIRADPRNLQGLLGLAAVQLQDGLADEAGRNYMRVLELDPRNTFAQAGLVSLAGRADPQAAETRLKQLIAREPLPALHFTLGNLYAEQSRWAEAQQSYFQAHVLESANPDYAYNLAVSLEHIGQPKLAAGFYRRAAELAPQRGRVGFNVNLAQERARLLAALAQ
ncbi:MAG: tetratricopeptide repeat protein [Betaproteobacteria bacterium]|jgi:Flp pilus assembly protein TadD|nr:tetratricopeptide repeat protein [Betaproteobacteria bacterium]